MALPGSWKERPHMKLYPLGGQWVLETGEGERYWWQEELIPMDAKERQLERQLQSAVRQYEELRGIAQELQEEARKLRDYIQREMKSGRRS